MHARNYHSRQQRATANSNNNHHHNHHHHHKQPSNSSSSLHKPLVSSNSTPPTTNSTADNMTTSSGSEHTVDDLQHLARAYQHQAASAAAAKHARANYPATAANFDAHARHYHNNNINNNSWSNVNNNNNNTYNNLNDISNKQVATASSRFLLGILYTIAQILLFAIIGLWLYWATQHDDGFGWQAERKQQFNTHAGLMLIGFVFCNCQAMLVYRSFSCCGKIYTKILHTIMHILAASAISLGLVLAFAAQENIGLNSKPIMHFYSLHAWTGLTTITLFGLQFIVGFFSFLVFLCCDVGTQAFRAALVPVHKTFGLTIFSLAIATCLTGLLQTARSRLTSKLNKIDYHELAEPALIINVVGACLVCLAIIVPYIVRNLDFKSKSQFASQVNSTSKLALIGCESQMLAAQALRNQQHQSKSSSSSSDFNRRLDLTHLDMRHM